MPDPVVTRLDGRTMYVVLNRPQVRNAVDLALSQALFGALSTAPVESDVVVIEGAGGNFSIGGDHREVTLLRGEGPDALARLFDEFGRACSLIAELPVPVIAAVDGFALAGGFELMQSCDFAIVADSAVIADNHANFGMIPGGGGSQRLPRLIGRQRALAHMLTGERLGGGEAVELGLALRAVSAGDLAAEVRRVALELEEKDRPALAEIKRLTYAGSTMPLAQGLSVERGAIVDFLLRPGALDAFENRKRR